MIRNNILAIWYPSGGFGHFINAVLSLYGQGFKRPQVLDYNFSANGNSHDLPLTAPKYLHDPTTYQFEFAGTDRYTVLIDNGINNEGKIFIERVRPSQILKICYSDRSWPIVARTMIEKAMVRPLEQQLLVDPTWPEINDWSRREKYYLYLRDHALRQCWREDTDCINLDVEHIDDYECLCRKLQDLGYTIDDFQSFWQRWKSSNQTYFRPINEGDRILRALEFGERCELSHITDLWDQAVINYMIWLRWAIEVPANDWAQWFTTSDDIRIMLRVQGIAI